MKIITGNKTYPTGLHYYYWVIDKLTGTIFIAQDFGCQAVLETELMKLFNMIRFDIPTRFYIVFSNTEINLEKIPKKYKHFKILD